MSASTESPAAPAFRSSAKRRPAQELVIAAFFGPLAHRLAVALLPTRIPPPAVVLAAGATGLVASIALALSSLVAAAVLLQLKTLLDNTDGGLARLAGRETLLGRYLDTESDTVLNLVLFAVLGWVTDRPGLALAAFCALTTLLSVNFNLGETYRRVRNEELEPPARSGGRVERSLELAYRIFFLPQDRLIRSFSSRRLESTLRAVTASARGRRRHSSTTTGSPSQCWRTSASPLSSSRSVSALRWACPRSISGSCSRASRCFLCCSCAASGWSGGASQREPLAVHRGRGIRAQITDRLGDLLHGGELREVLAR